MPAQRPQSQHKGSGVGCMCAQASPEVHRNRPAWVGYTAGPLQGQCHLLVCCLGILCRCCCCCVCAALEALQGAGPVCGTSLRGTVVDEGGMGQCTRGGACVCVTVQGGVVVCCCRGCCMHAASPGAWLRLHQRPPRPALRLAWPWPLMAGWWLLQHQISCRRRMQCPAASWWLLGLLEGCNSSGRAAQVI